MGIFDFVEDIVEGAADVVGGIVGGVADVAGGIVGGVFDIGGNIIGGALDIVGLDSFGKAINGALDDVGGFLDDAISFGGQVGAFGLDPINNLKGMLDAAGNGAPAGRPGEALVYDRDITEQVMAGLAQMEQGLHQNILDPLRGMQNRLGDVWVGSDADEVAQTIAQQLSQLESIADRLGALQSGLSDYAGSIDQADQAIAARLNEAAEQLAMIA